MSDPGSDLSSCARAASAAETRFRIDAPIAPARAPRVVLLDPQAAEIGRRAATHEWANASFIDCEAPIRGTTGSELSTEDLLLRDIDGSPVTLSELLDDADVVVLVATERAGSQSAAVIGRACFDQGVMTAGIVIGEGSEADAAVVALRPYARVLLPFAHESDVVELLTALRA